MTSLCKTCATMESSGDCPSRWTSLKNFTVICCIFSITFLSSSFKSFFATSSIVSDSRADLTIRNGESEPTRRSRENTLEPSAEVSATLPPSIPALLAAFKRAANASDSNKSFPICSESTSPSSSESVITWPSILPDDASNNPSPICSLIKSTSSSESAIIRS
ncbi:hypothetical protein OIU74_022984 [Salix koriyanagi]|uniref:Uncharacterized protein n=1 Tax=Salix koriyanagi TaxID=2511006 RepID=A0A9Q0WPL7_9ROSI|nr:hypothetical protein OIU74_022984 [Salix koriyanagi]